ncbi:ABC transporter substrate-binding protein [Chloroflexota bacterium]
MLHINKLPKHLMLLVSLIVAAMLVLPACASEEAPTPEEPTEPAVETKYGGTLRVAESGDTNTLDPAFTLSGADRTFSLNAYDNLVLRMHDLSLKPMLATSWEPSEDLLTWTFHLREGVKFHHGKVFNADDVVFTIERLIDEETGSPAKAALESIEKVIKVDDYTVRFELNNANSFFPESLSIYQARMTPSDIDPERFATEEFGTGPFILVEYIPGERGVFKKNPDYWDEGLPYLDEVILYYLPEPETRVEALKSGSVDVYNELAGITVNSAEAAPGVVLSEVASAAYLNMAMRVDTPPFDNKLLRQAIQAATDRELIRQTALLGRGVIGNDTTIPPNDPHYDQSQEIPPYDVEKAKRLLTEAGYPDGIDLTLHTSSVTEGMDEMAIAFKESAAPAGIRVSLKRHPEDVYWSNIWNVEAFTMVGWNGRPPDQALSIVYPCDAPWNETRICNAELDALIIRARGEVDLTQRKKTYAEVQRILIDDASRIIAVFKPIFLGLRDNVRGVSAHPNNWLPLHEAWLENK